MYCNKMSSLPRLYRIGSKRYESSNIGREPSTVKKNWDALSDIPVLYFLLFIAIG